jgi:hypothetical protein
MTVHRSFTSTWLAFTKGDLTGDDLIATGTLLVFGCKRAHVYPEVDDDSVPGEVSWATDDPIYTTRVQRVDIPTDVLEKWDEFRKVLDHVDCEPCTLVFSDDLQPYRISVKGTVNQASEAASAHGCKVKEGAIHSERDDSVNPCTIMTVSATLMLLGLWFNGHPLPPVGEPSVVGSLLYYSKEPGENEVVRIPLAMAQPPEGHYPPKEGYYPEDHIDCP